MRRPSVLQSWLGGAPFSVALAAAVSGWGCTGITDMSADEPCKNVGYSVASRTQACLGDGQLANARYQRFEKAYRCIVTAPTEADFQCAVDVNATSCPDVLAHGENWDQWLQGSPSCATIFRHLDGTVVIPDEGSDDVGMNVVCAAASDHAVTRRLKCTQDAASADQTAGYAELDATLRCAARWPAGTTPTPPKDCTDQLDNLACDGLADPTALTTYITAAPACGSILVSR